MYVASFFLGSAASCLRRICFPLGAGSDVENVLEGFPVYFLVLIEGEHGAMSSALARKSFDMQIIENHVELQMIRIAIH